jgi:hypothetical protein
MPALYAPGRNKRRRPAMKSKQLVIALILGLILIVPAASASRAAPDRASAEPATLALEAPAQSALGMAIEPVEPRSPPAGECGQLTPLWAPDSPDYERILKLAQDSCGEALDTATAQTNTEYVYLPLILRAGGGSPPDSGQDSVAQPDLLTDGVNIAPLSSTLHVLPPIGEISGDKNNLDETLTEYLQVSVWQVVGDDYTHLVDFMSEKNTNGLDYIKLQGKQYHVNWDIDKEEIGKEVLIHFTVADLSIGYVTYSPKVGRTLPIKFRIDNHPSIRARVLNEQGLTALEVTSALIDEFQLGAAEIVQLLTDEEYDVLEIGEILRDVFGVSPQEAAQLLANTDSYSASDIAQVLINVFGLVGKALEVSQILKGVGFSASQINDVLTDLFGLDMEDRINILKMIGFRTEVLSGLIYKPLAEKFAPQLRFDAVAVTRGFGFPMSAQLYFSSTLLITPPLKIENTVPGTLQPGPNQPPTYYKIYKTGNQIRILYKWFYGRQRGCSIGVPPLWDIQEDSVHDADWEQVLVTLSEDRSQVAAVTYFQHGGWYTRLANGGDKAKITLIKLYDYGLEFNNGSHPVVYVGSTQHGSYHNSLSWEEAAISYPVSDCFYFGDRRDNLFLPWVTLETEYNLKSMADFEEPWMEETQKGSWRLGTGNGTRRAFNLGSKFVISKSIRITVTGPTTISHTWTFSDSTSTKDDQVVFDVAPAANAEITAYLEKGDFKWGCYEEEYKKNSKCGVSGDAMPGEDFYFLWACKGTDYMWDPTNPDEKKTRGCSRSECRWHDNHELFVPKLVPGVCGQCPPGYSDMGLYCGKGTWPWEWRTRKKHYYWLHYTIPQTDNGLTQKSW